MKIARIFEVFSNRKFILQGFRLFFVLFSTAIFIFAEQLPIKTYSSVDGLASSVIQNITRDSKGFLWFCARGGLSRFDGYQFTTYKINDENASNLIHYFLETRDGNYWISTDNGLYRVRPQENTVVQPVPNRPGSGVRVLNAERVADGTFYVLYEDSKGRFWGGSGLSQGLFLIEDRDAEKVTLKEVDFSPTARKENRLAIRSVVEGKDDSLWLISMAGAMRMLPDGRWVEYQLPLAKTEAPYSIRLDNKGRVWFSHNTGVYVLKPESVADFANNEQHIIRAVPIEQQEVGVVGTINLPTESGKMIRLRFKENGDSDDAGQTVTSNIQEIFSTSDGKMWLPSSKSLYIFDGGNYARLHDTNSLPGKSTQIVEDLQGNLWFGTAAGVFKYVRNGLITYNQAGGLTEPIVHSIQETPNGQLLVVHGNWFVSILSAEGITTTQLNLPKDSLSTWTSKPIFQDKTGAVWSLANKGLYRFSSFNSLTDLKQKIPQTIDNPVIQKDFWYRAFPDSQSNIWFSTHVATEKNSLYKYNLQTSEWTDYTNAEGFPKGKSVASFAEDKAGNLWFGFYGEDGIVKFANGRFIQINEAQGLPKGAVLDLKVDGKGRLWISSTGDGLARLDDPNAANLKFIRYTENEGLLSNNVRCLAEDADGNIYAGTVRGVSQINQQTDKIKNLTTDDGLAADFVTAAFRDKQGAMWFGTANGLSKFEPKKETAPPVPQVLISDLQIAGTNYSVSEFGQRLIEGIEVAASQNNLRVDFFGIGEAKNLRYQYKLEGSGGDWSQPGEQRSVDFGNLKYGTYRLLIRAVNNSGVSGEEPAVISFRINPPFYQTWWFITLAVLMLGGSVFALDRYRVRKTRQVEKAYVDLQKSEIERREAETALQKSREERLKELERVRTRIATDLHDDIGSSLTQIAVLSEVARSQANLLKAEELSTPLERIKGVSKELVSVMSDIVWAINPTKDNLPDLVQRMRRFGSDVLSGRGIKFELSAPEVENNLALGANIRREVFAIFKEAVNNIVKYAEATETKVSFQIEDQRITLKIEDNGKGFDTDEILSEDFRPEIGGNGLINMRRRAKDLGGACEILSEINYGTKITINIPLQLPENLSAK